MVESVTALRADLGTLSTGRKFCSEKSPSPTTALDDNEKNNNNNHHKYLNSTSLLNSFIRNGTIHRDTNIRLILLGARNAHSPDST